MKKGWIIAAIALLLAGIAVCVVAMAVLGFNFRALSTVNYETRTYPAVGTFENISISTQTDEVRFLPSEDGKCSVVCREMEGVSHNIRVQDGALSIETVNERSWMDEISINGGSPSITVYLPGKAYQDVTVQTDTGDIEIPADFSLRNLQIRGDTADVECLADISGKAEIKLTTGDIRLSELKAGSLDLGVSTGEVTVRSVICSGDVNIHVSTGKTRLNGLQCAALRTDGSTGDITLKDVIASGTMTIERTTGDVAFEDADAAEIFVTTSTGEVKGTLRSEKVFITESDTGKQDVPKTITGGRCEITTDTGDIEIRVS